MRASDQPSGVQLDLATRHRDIREVLEHGEIERAAELCSSLLDEFPGDVTAHILMGDIYAARNDWVQAADWYSLAEEMGAGSRASERRAAAQVMIRRQGAPMPPARPEEIVEDLNRRRMVVRSIFAAAAVVAGLALVIAFLALFSRPSGLIGGRYHPTAPTPELPASSLVAPVPGRAASGQRPAAAPPARGAAPASRGAAPAIRPTPSAPAPLPHPMTVPTTDEDYLIAQAISGLTWPDGSSMAGQISVMMDPAQGYCVIGFRLPNTLPPARLYDTVIMQAYRVAQAAFATDPKAKGLTLRALATVPTPDRRQQTVEAFRANTTRLATTAFSTRYPSPTPLLLTQQLFGAPWWNPAVPPGQ